MKLTEKDYDTFVEVISREEFNELLKNQEKAKRWDELGTPIKIDLDAIETAERLKEFFNGDNVLTKSEYKQKILGGMDLTFATPNPTGEEK